MKSQRNKLKTGNRPVQQQTRTYKPGETLFEEGSTGRELFIIHEGSVGVYKDGPDGSVELAQLERGAIVGEMSLLDTLPRSATVKAIDKVTALVIGYAQFQSMMTKIPIWLQSIIKIVVSRLRDANRRVDQSILRNKERGLTALLSLLLPVYRLEIRSLQSLPYDTIVIEAYFLCSLRKKETVQLLTALEKRSIISITVEENRRYVSIPDREVLDLYIEYLALKDQKQDFKEVGIPRESLNVLSNIDYVAQKSGRETDDGTILSKNDLLSDIAPKNTDQLDRHLLDLHRRNIINLLPSEGETAIIFRKETLGRVKKIKEWHPKFIREFS